MDSADNLFIADTANARIRLLKPVSASPIAPGGVVPIFSPVSVIQPGSWVSIYGSNLAAGTSVWSGDFPSSLGGASVTVNSKPAYLWFVSPSQINLQAPDDSTTGLVKVVVNTVFGSAMANVTLAPYSPSFSLLGDGAHAIAEIPTPDGNGAYGGGTYDLAGPVGAFSFITRPIQAGQTLILCGVGFGPTTPPVLAGQPFSGAAPAVASVSVTIGGVNAKVDFAGMVQAGLYQLNVVVPPNTGSGDQPLRATVNGVQTPVGPIMTVQ